MGDKDTSFGIKTRPVKCRGKELDFRSPRIMGVLNLTPDSFYDGGKYHQEKFRAARVEQMIKEGADIIDIGAVSTRPGAREVSLEDEMNRLIWPLQRLVNRFPDVLFSVDTWRSEVARECILNGAHIINDISGGNFDDRMFETAAELNVPYILMHIHGTPENMQSEPIGVNIVSTIHQFFENRVNHLRNLGVEDIILDPGFGFGKTLKCNYTILKNLESLRIDDLPILGGISRKSMINKVINSNPSKALNGTTVLNTLALMNGANLLRVHDVKEAREAMQITEFYREFGACDEDERV
jgi:dihydropteroate synthase